MISEIKVAMVGIRLRIPADKKRRNKIYLLRPYGR